MSGDSSASSVKVRLLFFAKARELVGASEVPFDVELIGAEETTTGAQLLRSVLAGFPALDPIKGSVILAHNLEYVDVEGDTPIRLREDDEIAVIPPVSGG